MNRIIIAAAALTLAACGTKENNTQEIKTVMTVQAVRQTAQTEKHFSGIVKDAAEVSVAFKTAGQLIRIAVKEGQHISAGQLVAQLDTKDYDLALKAAESQYRQLKGEIERLRKLYEGNAVSGNDYDKAVSGLEQVEVNLQMYRNKIEYTTLLAPVSGFVEKVNFERSEMVDAGTPIITLLADGRQEVEVSLPLTLYRHRDQITQCTGTIAGHEYTLHLLSIVPKADNTQLYRARFAFESNAKDVAAGTNVDVAITTKPDSEAETLSLPMHALFQENGKNCVWVVTDKSTIHRTEVQTGTITDDGLITITSGLDGSEQVVKAGVSQLHEGDSVRVVSETSDTNVGGLL